jgi:hypothetical protein
MRAAAIPRALRSVDDALVAPAAAPGLVRVRAGLSVVLGLRLLARRWWTVAQRPAALFDPVAVVGWLHRPPGPTALVSVEVVGLVGVALVVSRRAPRLGFASAWVALLVLAALWGSSGKVMHNDVLPLLVAFPLLFADAPGSSAVDRSVRWGWPPRAALSVLATVYFLTGAQKVRHSGLRWVFSDNLSWVLRQGTSPLGHRLNHVIASHGALTRGFALGALTLELTAPVLLAVRRTRLPFAAAVTVLHLSIWLLLGLDYYGWALTAVAVTVAAGDRGASRWVASDR